MQVAGLDPNQIPEGEFKTDIIRQVIDSYPQGRHGNPSDSTRGVRYLIESPWTTGTILEMDGGFGAN